MMDGWDGIVADLLEPSSGRVIASVATNNPTALLTDLVATAVAPISGSYIVRVQGVEDRRARANYRLVVRRAP